jgi:hypothetical protein
MAEAPIKARLKKMGQGTEKKSKFLQRRLANSPRLAYLFFPAGQLCLAICFFSARKPSGQDLRDQSFVTLRSRRTRPSLNRQDGLRRDCLADHQPAVLCLQVKVSLSLPPHVCLFFSLNNSNRRPEPRSSRTSAETSTMSQVSATASHVRSPIRATPPCGSTRPSRRCIST